MAVSKLDMIGRYVAGGWAIVPLKGKVPTLPDWPHLSIAAAEIPHYFGNGENVGVILGEKSGGLVDIDLDHFAAVRAAPYYLPDTKFIFGRASNPLSHRIYVSPGCEMHQFKTPGDGSLVELRANGQTMFPPSIHPSGERVELEGRHELDLPEPSRVHPEKLERAVRCIAAAAVIGIHWPAMGSRHDASLALSGGLFGTGWSPEECEKFIGAVCAAAQDEEVNDRVASAPDTMGKIRNGQPTTGWTRLAEFVGKDTVSKAREWLNMTTRIPPNDTIVLTPGMFHDSDLGNGERLATRHADKLRYVWIGRNGYWMVWDGKRWIESQSVAEALAKETVRSIYAEVSTRTNDAERERGRRWAHQSEGAARVNAMLELARSEPAVAASPDLFDKSPWILNLQNGYIDLQEYPIVLHRHDPNQYLTKLADCSFDGQAKCPVWTKTLERAFGGDADLIAYAQAVFGYSLTGITSEQKFWICWGTGANGKSTILGTLRHILGDYAQQVNSSTILLGKTARTGDIPRSDLANTRKMRLLCAIEVSQGQRLDDSMIKQVTGGELITARKLYHSDAISFVPEFKLLLACNHKPLFPPDGAMARRIRLIPFTVSIPPGEQDSELAEKLKAEASGILNFCLEGFQYWHKLSWLSKHEPPAVQSATHDYLRELDPLTPFLDACCDIGPGTTHRTQANDLFRAYKAFVKDNPEFGGECDSVVVFSRRMQDAGSRSVVEKRRLRGKIFWCGIRLKTDSVRDLALDDTVRGG